MNPWGLTEAEAQALDELIVAGNQKEAARTLGIGGATLNSRCERARRKIGKPGHFRYLIEWDRFRQASRAFSGAV